MVARRDFIKKASMGVAAISMSRLAQSSPNPTAKIISPTGGKIIDAHIHVTPGKVKNALQIMDDNSIRYAVIIASLSQKGEDYYYGDRAFYEQLESIKPYKNRLCLHYTYDWKLAETDPDFFKKAPDMLEKAVKAGAIALKNLKELGLEARDYEGKMLAIDDPRLFPIWERAEKLNIPVAFHTGDPVAFFQPWNPENERWEELELHPEWSFADRNKYPSLETLFEQVTNVYRKFSGVKFQGAHVACYSENITQVGKWLDEFPNLSIDTAARVGELGRHSAKDGHDFFTKYQDRIMFGTDLMYYNDCDVQGAGPCKNFTMEEQKEFYNVHWRYFQTNDKQFDHPTPIQGKWKIDGIGLHESVLKKLYWENSMKFYKLNRFNIA